MPPIQTPLVQLLNPVRQTSFSPGSTRAPVDFAARQQTRLSEIQNREIQAKQAEQLEAESKFKLLTDKKQQTLQSLALGASEVLPSLEKGDVATANKLLDLRRLELQKQNIPTTDTDEFQALLNSDPDLAKTQARNAIQTAKLAGAIKTNDGSQVPFQLGQSRTVKNEDGKLVSVTEVFNRVTGQVELSETPISGDIVSKNLGETAEDQRKRTVLTKTQEKSAGFAQKASAEAFGKIQPIRESITLYDKAIDLLDQGADTGAVNARLPSIADLAVNLDNIQSQLGLNVIRNTTFGSLSEAELKFALSSALPQKLSGPELRKWLVDKRDAQDKLAGYITDSAIYLGQPGNSIASWMQLQQEQKKQADALKTDVPPVSEATKEQELTAPTGLTPEETTSGARILVDGNGNRAVVLDGKVLREL